MAVAPSASSRRRTDLLTALTDQPTERTGRSRPRPGRRGRVGRVGAPAPAPSGPGLFWFLPLPATSPSPCTSSAWPPTTTGAGGGRGSRVRARRANIVAQLSHARLGYRCTPPADTIGAGAVRRIPGSPTQYLHTTHCDTLLGPSQSSLTPAQRHARRQPWHTVIRVRRRLLARAPDLLPHHASTGRHPAPRTRRRHLRSLRPESRALSAVATAGRSATCWPPATELPSPSVRLRRRWCTLEGTAVVKDDAESVTDAERRYAERYKTPRPNPKRVVIEIHVTKAMGTAKPSGW